MNVLAIDPSVLSIFVLVGCLTCIWMVFFFGRRLQTSAYLRESLIEGAKQQELKVLLRDLMDRAKEGPLDPNNPPPEGYGPTVRLWEKERYAENSVEAFYYPDINYLDEDPVDEETRKRREKERAEIERKKAERAEREKAYSTWEKEEMIRYDALRKKYEDQALKQAEKKIPSSIDISLLGGGWAFLLEFSTVIVIIFTLLILGILEILEGQEISTILAAIAGYVLGKATSGTKETEKNIRQKVGDSLEPK